MTGSSNMAKLLLSNLFFNPIYYHGYQRSICTSAIYFTKQQNKKTMERRTERYLKKRVDLLNGTGDSAKQRKWTFPVIGEASQGGRFTTSGPKPGNPHRARQLSVVFNKYITSMISSGEVCPELLDHGFEIVKVVVPPDLGTVNVHWLASGSDKDNEVMALLPKCASALRSTLTGLRLMGHVPPIQFPKDLTAAKLQKVEELLKIADMGPDEYETEKENDGLDDINIGKIMNQKSINDDIQQLSKRFTLETEKKEIPDDLEQTSDFHDTHVTSQISDEELRDVLSHCNTDKLLLTDAGVRDSVELPHCKPKVPQPDLRYDLYGVPHEELKFKILQTKRKLQDRIRKVSSEQVQEEEKLC